MTERHPLPSSHKTSQQKLHDTLQIAGSASAAFLALGALAMILTCFVVADFNIEVAIILASGATPGLFLRWLFINALLVLPIFFPFAVGALFFVGMKRLRRRHPKTTNTAIDHTPPKISSQSSLLAGWTMIIISAALLTMNVFLAQALYQLWYATLFPAFVALYTWFLLAQLDKEFARLWIIIFATISVLAYLVGYSPNASYWTPFEKATWGTENHVVQHVTTVDNKHIFFAPMEKKIYRIDKKEITSREYCLDINMGSRNNFGIDDCPSPNSN